MYPLTHSIRRTVIFWAIFLFLMPLQGYSDPSRGVVGFTTDSLVVEESDGKASVGIERTGISKGDLTVTVRAISGDFGATSGVDYELINNTATWDSGETGIKRISFRIFEDDLIEDDEFFELVIASRDGADAGKVTSLPVRIKDSTGKRSEPGLINFSPTSYTVDEDDGFVTLTVARTDGSDGPARFRYTVGGGRNDTAKADSDYTAADGELVWDDGESGRKAFSVKVLEDNLLEDDERFTVSLSRVSGDAALGQFPSAQITIRDTTPEPEPKRGTIRFQSSSYEVEESAGSVTLILSRVDGSDEEAEAFIRFGISDDSAESGDDYRLPESRQVRWGDGDSANKRLTVSVLEDELIEGEEFFTVIIDDVSGADIGSPSSARVRIIDTTQPPREPGVLEFVSTDLSVAEDTGSVTLKVRRTGGTDGEVSVNYATGANDDSATVGEDYERRSGTLRWADGDSGEKSISIPVIEDNVLEAVERFSVLLYSPSNDAQLGNKSRATVSISDTSQSGSVALTDSSFRVSEAQGALELRVRRSGGSAGAVSVSVSSGASGDTATSGEDYTSVTETLRWGQGDSSDKTITLNIANDDLFEGEEFFTIALSNPQGGVVLTEPSLATVTIENSTPARNGTLQFQSGSYSANESDGSIELAVERSGGSDGRVSLSWSAGQSGDSAIAGEDYEAASGELIWEDGDSSTKSFSISLIDDAVGDPGESFTVVLSGATGGAVIGDTNSSTVSIIDEGEFDFSPALEIISGDQQSGFPGDMLDPFVISVSNAGELEEGQVVNWSVSPADAGRLLDGNTSSSGSDGQASNSLEILTGGVITVTARVETTEASNRAAGDEPNVVHFTVNAGFEGSAGLTDNQRSVGGALDKTCSALAVRDDLSAAQADLLSTCERLETLEPGDIAAGLDRLMPEELFAVGTLSVDTADLQVTNVQSRINAIRAGSHGLDLSSLNLRLYGQDIPGYVVDAAGKSLLGGGGAASSDDYEQSRWGVFVNGTLSTGSLDESDIEMGLDFDSQNLTAGVDYRLTDSVVLGGAVGVLTHKGDYSSEGGSIELGATQITGFVTWYNEDRAYVDAIVSLGSGSFEFKRRVNLAGDSDQFAEGNPDSSELSFSLGAGLEYNNGPWSYGPYGRFSLINAEVDAYDETASHAENAGVGSVLSIEKQSIDSTSLVLGGHVSKAINTTAGVFLPQLRLELEHRLDDSGREIKAAFLHDPDQNRFTIESEEVDTDFLNLGLGVSAVFRNGKSAFINYESRFGQDRLSQNWIKAGFRLEF